MGRHSTCLCHSLLPHRVLLVRMQPSVRLVFTYLFFAVWAIDLGFATHGVHMDHRSVKLVSSLSSDKKTLSITGPPSGKHYPPGPAFIYVVTDAGVPSFGHKTIIGTGASPPVDQNAIAK